MRFIDEAIITVQSGNGGKGCVSFRRERFVPNGGPDGGDGGKGGDVILTVTTRKRTLYHFQFQRQFKAKNGGSGQGQQRTGKDGEDIIIEIPPGTLVTDADTGKLVKDFTAEGETLVIAKGGRGGQGNKRFATSTNRSPRFAQPGEEGETLKLKMELKLLADVGIIGLPNAGKSTLTRAVSSANPRVGAYPFTTLSPNLGAVYLEGAEPFVVADIPGLIEGAHKGAGLGIQFLRHIERTRILIHLIDASAVDPEKPLSGYNTVNNELGLYSKDLPKKPQIVVLNKMDMPEAVELAEKFQTAAKKAKIKAKVICVSAVTRQGVEELTSALIPLLTKEDKKGTKVL